MPTSILPTADDWERQAAQRIAGAGIVADREAVRRAGRTLARLARTFDTGPTPCAAATASSPAPAAQWPSPPARESAPTPVAAARAGAAAHAAFVAALASLARE